MRAVHATVLVVALVLLAPITGAEERSLLISGIFADPSVVGPFVRYTTGDPAGTEYSATLLGWTLEGQWIKHRSPRQAFVLSADVTPVNAHSSDRIYVGGERVHELEYEASSYRIRGGLRLTPNERSTTDLLVVGLVERVDDLEDSAVTQFWDEPFVGVDLAHTYQVTSSNNPLDALVARFDGFSVTARVEAFSGRETWARVSLGQRSGAQFGKFHLRQSLLVLSGKSLNVVSRAVIGGSWDVLGEAALYGSRYAEFRVARGVLANAGADYELPRGWRVGVRGSYMNSDVDDVYGAAINASKIRKTFGFNMGVGFPLNRSGDSDPVVYLAVIAPLYANPR